jgi:hypothetical protein
MMKVPLILFIVALAITIPSMIIFYDVNVNGEELNVEIGPTNCNVGMSSVDKILCKKLDKILENQEAIIDHLTDIYDMNS